MKTALITGARGPLHIAMQALTLPAMRQYAERHGYDLRVVDLPDNGRPASWEKLPMLIDALRTYDQALWLDADIAIINGEVDITADVDPVMWQALVIHGFANGNIPNCGVWLVRKPMIDIMNYADEVSYLDETVRNHPWWEQAFLMMEMGYDINVDFYRKINTGLWDYTHLLPVEWNWIGLPANELAYFRHGAGIVTPLRMAMLCEWLHYA